jgi:hypothetical protein
MKKSILLLALVILFATNALAQDYVSKPPWIVDENMYIKGMVWVDSNLVPSRDCHWYLGVDSLRWKAYVCTLWCNVGFFDQIGLNCADSGKVDTSFFEDVWIDTVHSCSSVLVIDNDTTFFDGNGNDAKILQFCELLDAANTENAFLCSALTDAGANANIRRAFKAILADGGYTGNSQTYAGYFYNSAGGTGAAARNYGLLGYSVQAAGVENIGVKGVVENGDINIGIYGQSIDDVDNAENFGALGIASNDGASAYHCAGYFDLGDGTLPTLTFSSTIIGDNHNYTDNHLTLMDDLFPVFVVADGGDSAGVVYIIDNTPDTTTIRPTAIVVDTGDFSVIVAHSPLKVDVGSLLVHATETSFRGASDTVKIMPDSIKIKSADGETKLSDQWIYVSSKTHTAIEASASDSTAIFADATKYAVVADGGTIGLLGYGDTKYGAYLLSASTALYAGRGGYTPTSDTVAAFAGTAIFPTNIGQNVKSWIDTIGAYRIIGGTEIRATAVESDSGIFGVLSVTDLTVNGNIIGTSDAGEIQWDGFVWELDYDSDDSLAIICFDALEGDTLRSDTINHILTWTGAGGFLGMDAPGGADTFRIYDDGDTTHITSDNPFAVDNDIRFDENAYADTFFGVIGSSGACQKIWADTIFGCSELVFSVDSVKGDEALFEITKTFPTGAGTWRAIACSVTTAGSNASSYQYGLYVDLLVGYTGTASTYAGWFQNDVTGNGGWSYGTWSRSLNLNGSSYNCGTYGEACSSQVNIGVAGNGTGSGGFANVNVGVYGLVQDAIDIDVGGYFVVGQSWASATALASAFDCALIADNDTTEHTIFSCIDATVNVMDVLDGGTTRIMDASDTTFIYPTSVHSDSGVFTAVGVTNLTVDGNIIGTTDAGEIQWDGFVWELDYDSDDSLAIICFDAGEGDTLRSDTINHILTWTGAGGFLGMDAPGGADSIRFYDDGTDAHISTDNQVWFNNNVWIPTDTLFFTDGGADTSLIVQDGTYLKIDGDNQIYLNGTGSILANQILSCQLNLIGAIDAGEIQWDGFVWELDYDSDDSLAIICFDALEGDTLRSDTINHNLTWTGAGGFLGMDAPAGADTFRLFDDGDTCHWSSDNPHKIESNTVIQGNFTARGLIASTSITRGQATFTRNTIVDTVPGVTGVSTNSFITVTGKMGAALNSGLTWEYLNTDSILVHILEDDTTGQAVTYCWIRME